MLFDEVAAGCGGFFASLFATGWDGGCVGMDGIFSVRHGKVDKYNVCNLVEYVRYQRLRTKLDKSQSDRTFLGIWGFQTRDLQNLGVSEPRFTRTLAGRQDTFMSVVSKLRLELESIFSL